MVFTYEQLKNRAFQRVADALFSYWEEQKDSTPRTAAVHSRLFETLIYNTYIELNKKTPGREYPEHVVPCAYIRNRAFEMYWDGKSPNDVAQMISRLLKIAYITKEQASTINAVHRYTMPDNWNPETDCILRRLTDADIKVVDPVEIT